MEMVCSTAALKSDTFLILTSPFAVASKQPHSLIPSISIPYNPTTNCYTPSSSSSSSSMMMMMMFSIHHNSKASTTRTTNASHISAIRAQSSTTTAFIPEANFYKVEAILRPWRVPQVSSALLKIGIRGVTVSDVRGFGAQGGFTERQAGSEFAEDNFVAKVKMEIVVSKDQVEAVIDKIIEEARTGEIGDGKIFVVPVADVIRIRTGERGEEAARMMGGRADMMISAESPPV